MSGHLWKSYFQDDVDAFRHTLENATHPARTAPQKSFAVRQSSSYGGAINSSPLSHSASPALSTRGKRSAPQQPPVLTRADINSRDSAGLTILHHVASSTSPNALAFAQALIEHPYTDLYIQDAENGWTPLHRAFYFGNVSIARMILNRDTQDILGHGSSGYNAHARGLVKIKDKEGFGPLDLFSVTIKDRTLRPDTFEADDAASDYDVAQGDSGDQDEVLHRNIIAPRVVLGGDEVFTFGSNKNVTLGFGDEDDRQFPERIVLRRPDHLLQRFYQEHKAMRFQTSTSKNAQPPDHLRQSNAVTDLPVHIRNTPVLIQDVQMSKLHSAVLTTDPVSNLYMCGHGPGGRLGTGNEATQYQFVCLQGGGLSQKRIIAVALGQNHTLAITDDGEVFSWGNNAFGQLGYSLPKPALKDDEPSSALPRQIYGPLKRELVLGVAASRIHSVAHTASSLYTFGKNEGQLGIVDSDARSLDVQVIPRKIAASLFSSNILSVSAIDGASICLLENRDVWVFANYGYAKINFPLEGFSNYFLSESWLTTKYDSAPNRIKKITSGGDTICALSSSGEVFTVTLSRRAETSLDASTSTTNPKQIRGALSQPYRIWSAKSSHMAARDVDVDQDGSVILTTEAGTVWRRTKRTTIKNASVAGAGDNKPKDYKFLRVPGLTRVIAVRSSAFGAYAAIRKDCDVTRNQIGVDEAALWKDLAPLCALHELATYEEGSDDEDPSPRFWQRPSNLLSLRKRALRSKDLEAEVLDILSRTNLATERGYDMVLGSTVSDVRIPVHECIISGRSGIFRDFMKDFDAQEGDLDLPDCCSVTRNEKTKTVLFPGVDFLSIFNLVLYAYTDSVVDFWNATRQHPQSAFRYRTVRAELLRIGSRLGLGELESAVRHMVHPKASLDADMALAVKDASFFATGDMIVDLADGEMQLHSKVLCQRCPFFEGLFQGRAGGQWLAGRRDQGSDLVRIDLTHVESHLFELVVRHIYTDAGEEIFDYVRSEDFNDYLALDELLDHVMDIMSIANELMLDRLGQICQRLIGRYVNSRNICSLLNAISPSSVAEFKDAGLEYVCLSLEAVMQNSSLDELDDDLLLDLDEVVRDNQLATLPFARSGRAEAILFDKYPELAEKIERGRRAKVDAIVLSNKFVEAEGLTSVSFRAQSLEELSASPLRHKTRRKSRDNKTSDAALGSPNLKEKGSVPDLIFEMSDEEHEDGYDSIKPLKFGKTPQEKSDRDLSTASTKQAWSIQSRSGSPRRGPSLEGVFEPETSSLRAQGSSAPVVEPRNPGRPWGASPLGGAKLDMRDIMSQASTGEPSNIALGLSRQEKSERPSGSFTSKISQKERKRRQQADHVREPQSVQETQTAPPSVSPWQAMSQRKPLGNVSPAVPQSGSPASSAGPSSTPQLTMRQTVANGGAASKKRDARQQRQQQGTSQRSTSNGKLSDNRPGSASGPGMSVSTTPIPTPHSIRHIPLPSQSPTAAGQHFSLTEILSMQQAEKDYVKDAASKRSLQEIQQEQEFQQWWEQESRRVMHEEEQRKRAEERGVGAPRGRGRGRQNKSKVRSHWHKGADNHGEGDGEKRDTGQPAATRKTSEHAPGGPRRTGGDGEKGRGRPQKGGRGGARGGRGPGPGAGDAHAQHVARV